MPIIYEQQIAPAKKLAIWQITEDMEFFMKALGQEPDPAVSKKRQLEKAVCSFLLNTMAEEDLHMDLDRDIFGKPYFRNNKASVSFSHSKDMVACILDTSGRAVGVDIEWMRDRILALSEKFINTEDHTPYPGTFHCHLIWGAKEVLYKIYSKKELDFKKHMTVRFDKNLMGIIHKDDVQESHALGFKELYNFILVWNI